MNWCMTLACSLFRLTAGSSLIVPDITISLYGSSCKSLLCSLIVACLLSFSIYWHPKCRMGSQEKDGERNEEIIRPQQRECMDCCTLKWLKIRDYQTRLWCVLYCDRQHWISISISQLVLIGLFGAGENKVEGIYCSSFIETEYRFLVFY